jgi:DNA-directed RNA polymerase specialized sigma24 family protein
MATEKKPRPPSVRDLRQRAGILANAQEAVDVALQKRDAAALSLANRGHHYQELAEAMGITVDGVTYVLRKARKAQQTAAVDAQPTDG